MNIGINIGGGRFLMLFSTPNVAEGTVVTSHLALGVDEPWFGWIGAIYDSGGEVGLLDYGTVFVIAALLDVLQHPRIVYVEFRGSICPYFFGGEVPYIKMEFQLASRHSVICHKHNEKPSFRTL